MYMYLYYHVHVPILPCTCTCIHITMYMYLCYHVHVPILLCTCTYITIPFTCTHIIVLVVRDLPDWPCCPTAKLPPACPGLLKEKPPRLLALMGVPGDAAPPRPESDGREPLYMGKVEI